MHSLFTASIKLVFAFLLGKLICVSVAQAQVTRKYALTIQTDNDSYLMRGQDQYYTNGIAVGFSMPLQYSAKHVDLLSVNVGHQLFNGNLLGEQNEHSWDRPSTGRFYLQGQYQRSYAQEWLWNVKVELGLVGEAGKGQQIQQFIHRAFRMYEVESWEATLQSKVGVDVGASVMKKLWRNQGQFFDVSSGVGARLGMNFSNLSTDLIFRLGKLASFNCSYMVGNAGFVSGVREYYLFYSPSYVYQLYNITIQGELNSAQYQEPYAISRSVFGQRIGAVYSHNRFSIEAAFLYNTKEGRAMKTNHQYGRIKVGLRF